MCACLCVCVCVCVCVSVCVQAALSACQHRCTKLVQQFANHLSLLSLDARTLKAQMGASRSVLKPEDWHAAISKYRYDSKSHHHNLNMSSSLHAFTADHCSHI